MPVYTEEKLHACDSYGTRFHSSFNLKLHKLMHTGLRPFSCELCGKRFINSYAMKIHKLSHTTIKPYSCVTSITRIMKKNHPLSIYSCIRNLLGLHLDLLHSRLQESRYDHQFLNGCQTESTMRYTISLK